MAIYKYFTEEAHAQALIKKGEMMFKPLSSFRILEDGDNRGDPHDGALNHGQPEGLQAFRENGEPFVLDQNFHAAARGSEIFVYCASNHLSDEIAEKLGRFCVEINDPDILIRRLRLLAQPDSKIDYKHVICGPVDYRPGGRPPGVDWALPERLVLTKPEHYGWQDEYRIAIGQRNALDVHAVDLHLLADGAAPPQPAGPVPAPIFIRVGPLGEAVALHRL
jgi:hypothetical protein